MGRFDRLKAIFKESYEHAKEDAKYRQASPISKKNPGYYVNGKRMTDSQWRNIYRQQAELREQTERLYKFRRKDLIEIGTSIELITDAKIAEDAAKIANELCGARISPEEKPGKIELAPQALTKSGKCPKCIAIASCSWRWEKTNRVVCDIGYLANAQPYKADVLRLVKNSPVHYTIRTVDRKLKVTNKW